jgi:hypothetical protein
MLKFDTNLYIVKGRIRDIDSSTFEGLDRDTALLQQEKYIIPHLESILAKDKQIKSGKKSKDVWFVELENVTWLESGSLKNWEKTVVTIKKTDHTPASFVKAGKQQIKDDLKAIARPDKEEDYSQDS